jgi:flagellar hook-associated protein 3 FlgL
MRVSTNNIYDTATQSILQQQAALLKTQQQVSTGRRITVPADDPVAAAQALVVSQTDAMNTQYGSNRSAAKGALGLMDSVLDQVSSLIHEARSTSVQAGNAALSNSDRTSLANALQGSLDEMMGLANTRDGSGNYMFSGYQNHTQSFAVVGGVVTYNGDDGSQSLQVSASRQIGVTASGRDIFERILNGNGVFSTAAAGTNTGSGVINQGSVVNAAALTGQNYAINFTVAAGVTTYSVVNTTTATTLSVGNPYTSGQAISFDGMQVQIDGAPANGDQFTVAPSTHQSVFTTMQNLITALRNPVTGSASAAQLQNSINQSLTNFDQSLDNVLRVRAQEGSSLKEIDSLDATGESLGLQYKQQLSELQDVDYAQAISDLTRQQAYLQAAQQSFIKVVSNKLFDFISA